MRRFMLASAITGATLLVGYGTAMAQVVIETPPAGVYVGPSYNADYYTYDRDTRVYGYTRYYRDDDDDVVVVRPGYRNGCGTYRYWNGDRCVDARR